MHYRDKCCLSEQRLVNLKMSRVWAICKINIKCLYTLDVQVKGIKYSYSLTQHGGSYGISIKEKGEIPDLLIGKRGS